jgi:hypothetical protein
MTYICNSWGNAAASVSSETVAKIRTALYASPWMGKPNSDIAPTCSDAGGGNFCGGLTCHCAANWLWFSGVIVLYGVQL